MSEINNGAAAGGGQAQGQGNQGAQGGAAQGAGAAQGGQGAGAGGEAGAAGGAGGGGGSWLDTLPAEYKDDQSLKGFKTVEDLAKSYLHAQKMIGVDKIPVPSQHATDQDWQNVFKKLGLPESPDKYDLKPVEGHKPEDLKAFKETAHKLGILPKQAEALYKFDIERQQQMQAAQETQRKEMIKGNLDKLKAEWTPEKYGDNLKQAAIALNNIGPEFMEWADKCGVGDDPMFLKMMHKISGMMSEDTLKGAGGAASFGESKASLQTKINSIMGNQSHPYWDSQHPGHKAAVEEMLGLQDLYSKAR